ncbi:multi-pass transmembrane protein [Reticulomyxa filosa]|uniref:GPI mannosyltransferase 2 n=1 Tax=Reticulomyxa filosa TaxID=46433 RepID=X6MU77_RETFI|nr:multi-pass transmembrane protein [Reticulomyxa filosa]|eukprot:ETO16675.1 multi-pass transmembrane protein [Reticulomyxa filosa]
MSQSKDFSINRDLHLGLPQLSQYQCKCCRNDALQSKQSSESKPERGCLKDSQKKIESWYCCWQWTTEIMLSPYQEYLGQWEKERVVKQEKKKEDSQNEVSIISELFYNFLFVKVLIVCLGSLCYYHFASFDKSSTILHKQYNDPSKHAINKVLYEWLGWSTHWDGEHFISLIMHYPSSHAQTPTSMLSISIVGYEHEKEYAFFPGLPLIIHSISVNLHYHLFHSFLTLRTCHLVVSFIWNSFTFFMASVLLYYLTKFTFFNNHKMVFFFFALLSSKLFLMNPANIFFNAMYTESTFSFCSLLLLLSLEMLYFHLNSSLSKYQCNMYLLLFVMVISLWTCGWVRSNGILLIGFPFYYLLISWLAKCSNQRLHGFVQRSYLAFKYIALLLFVVLIGFMPVALFQYYAIRNLCHWDQNEVDTSSGSIFQKQNKTKKKNWIDSLLSFFFFFFFFF